MALACNGKLNIACRLKWLHQFGVYGRLTLKSSASRPCFPAMCQQVASLTSVSNTTEPLQRLKPWPYKTRTYGYLMQFIDKTLKRMNENSKIVVVDGNIGVGKSEFAKKIAKEFDLKFFPDIMDKDCFTTPSGFDIRSLSEQLPVTARPCDFKDFYLQNVPKSQLARISCTQYNMYKGRFFQYLEALNHLMNTGQGVILERCAWSDIVFVETMRDLNYITEDAYQFLKIARTNTLCELWKPHLVVYLDAPLSHIKQVIQKRNVEYEVNSPVLNDQFIQGIGKSYKQTYLKEMKHFCEILEYDVSDMLDWEIIVEDLESQNLDSCPEEESKKFEDWQSEREDDWACFRSQVSKFESYRNLFHLPFPWKAKKMYWTGDDALAFKNCVLDHPDVCYNKRFNPNNVKHYLQF